MNESKWHADLRRTIRWGTGTRLRRNGALALSIVLAACGGAGPDAGGSDEWVGTIETTDGVTTVVNESGSVWGGDAVLVEEASIGVDAGDDPYMLGRVTGIAASDDRIYIADQQVPALRVYDWDGLHLSDLGRAGEGPGEFRYPTGVGVDARGRVWLHDQISLRLVVFAPDGAEIATHQLGGMRISGGVSPLTVTADGHGYVFGIRRPDERTSPDDFRMIMTPYDVDGSAGEPIGLPSLDEPGSDSALIAETAGATRFTSVPFYPRGIVTFAPTRAVIVGDSGSYRFEITMPGGETTIVERAWDPIDVDGAEADAHRDAATRYMRDLDPDWTWNGGDIPATKPAFSDFIPAVSGEVWVVRPGPGTPLADCDPASFDPRGDAPCWEEQRIVDVFGPDGRYLGELDIPDELQLVPRPFIRGGDVIAPVEDEAGTIMVKRYRLVPPSAGES